MKFIHTADWHLGRKLGGQSLLNEQREALNLLLAHVREHRPDALLLSGDVYDRAVPPPDAVALLDDVLSDLHAQGVPVVMIAGNHDGAERLSFLRGPLSRQQVHVTGWPGAGSEPVVLRDEHGDVQIHSVPFADPVVTRWRLQQDVSTFEDAMEACLGPVRAARTPGVRQVLLAHAHVAGANATPGAERRLSASGNDTVNVSTFDGFDYVALGHLHAPQDVGGLPHVRYSGSLYKYCFDEDHEKGALLVEMDGAGACTCTPLPLQVGRDVRRIEAEFQELLDFPEEFAPADDYLSVTLRDRTQVRDAIYRLREKYPNVLEVQYLQLDAPRVSGTSTRDARIHTPLELFESFYQDVHGQFLTFEDRVVLEGLIDRDTRQAQEVTL